jgi:hypothetical protein
MRYTVTRCEAGLNDPPVVDGGVGFLLQVEHHRPRRRLANLSPLPFPQAALG